MGQSHDRFGVLGPLVVHRGDTEVPITAAKQRVVLAALLLNAGRSVSTAELIRCVWGDDPPARAAQTLPVYVMRLRRVLGEPRLIDTTPTGYRITVEDGALDLQRFRSLAAEGAALAANGRPDEARAACERALACWRGPVLADVDADWLPTADLVEERRRVDRAALRPAVEWSPVSQLPAPVGNFVGRTEELARVSALLPGSGATTSPTVVVSGPPGVGKTAVAISVGHALRARFPDGQLHVDLRGHSSAPTLSTTAVLARFLRATGVRGDRIPLDEPSLATAYQAQLRGRRVLVILDNAMSAEQVLPLLPGDPACSVLITSRRELDLPGSTAVRLDVLPPADAQRLLRSALSADARDEVVAELARLCGYLPLALRISLGNLVGAPRGDVERYVSELREGDRLTALAVENDDSAAVRRAFDLSYTTLRAATAELFRLLGLVPGPDVSAHGAAALLDTDPETAEALLGELVTANLVQRLEGDRFGMPDLLREYAAERARRHERDGGKAAVRRLLNWYLRTSHEVAHLLFPELDVPRPAPPRLLADETAAKVWLDTERPNLFAAAERCAVTGPTSMAWQLVNGMGGYLGTHGHHVEFLGVIDAALDAARREGDRAAETRILVWMAAEHRNLGNPRLAMSHITAAGEPPGSEVWLLAAWRGILALDLNDLPLATAAFGRLLELSDEAWAVPYMRASALTGLGAVDLMTGDVDRAIERLTEGVEVAGRSAGINVKASCTSVLARCHLALGEHAKAVELLRLTSAQWDVTGSRHLQAETQAYLAMALSRSGEHGEAAEVVGRALATVREEGATYRIECEVRNASGLVLCGVGEYARSVQEYRLALESATAGEYRYGAVRALLGTAEAHLCANEYAQALDHSRMALAMAVQSGFGLFEVQAREMVAGLLVTQLTDT
ncbi:winged helix-turn-helix domain-containing protein [Umezawaea sp. Da 62-37]|uniref:ATP-binding protein n=1 Tax=Umezawaea sp. Da 62-37 TaxID=3075927 RepID=UPI0028F6FE2D|nr:winged helix-turn-helix domain-containing protein [Umezawaea sp. Da 62-37]WNV84153.1 winged helix-turn-helix domain-containing protein [Umezawaea sp. Da 62-37]